MSVQSTASVGSSGLKYDFAQAEKYTDFLFAGIIYIGVPEIGIGLFVGAALEQTREVFQLYTCVDLPFDVFPALTLS